MRYEWDAKKSLSNYEKHGIRFEDGQKVWSDPNALEFIDESDCEDRFLKIRS